MSNRGYDEGQDRCRNCGAPVDGTYCSTCGQRNLPTSRRVGDFLSEAFGEFFSLESKLLRTAKALLFRPGVLTAAYWAGQRQMYSSPFRIYIFAGILAFLVLSFSTVTVFSLDVKTVPPITEDMSEADLERLLSDENTLILVGPDFFAKITDRTDPLLQKKLQALDILIADEDTSDSARRNFQAMRRTMEQPRAFNEQVNLWLSRFLILFVAVLALIVLPLFPRRYVVEHLVFAVHLQAFTLVAVSAVVLFSMLTGIGQGATFFTFAAVNFAYALLALKKAYANGWIVTVLKFLVFQFFYLVFVVTGGMAVMLAAGWSLSRVA